MISASSSSNFTAVSEMDLRKPELDQTASRLEIKDAAYWQR
jgi:hypothetical protein